MSGGTHRTTARAVGGLVAAIALTACAPDGDARGGTVVPGDGTVDARDDPGDDGGGSTTSVTDARAVPGSDAPSPSADPTIGGSADVDGESPDDGTDTPAAAEPQPFDPGEIDWEQYDDSIDVARVEVPRDYADPDGERIGLFVARHRAADPEERIGTLLVNPGGPGFPGSAMVLSVDRVFSPDLVDRFDIVGWDPRGTGASEPAIDCIDDYDRYFTAIDSTPDDQSERDELVRLAEEFADACADRNGDVIDHVGTNDSARDIDSLRRALGEDRISYFGFSYGSELGAVWATLFPSTVRAAVLDGAADPTADALDSSLQQLAGFEASLDTFLARCDADGECAFVDGDGDAGASFDELMAQLDAAPLEVDPDRPPVNRDVALTAVVQAMYDDALWPALEQSLSAAQRGDGSGLLELNDRYYQRRDDGSYGDEHEAFRVISCADDAERPTVEEADERALLFTEVAPRLVPEGSAGGYGCSFFPATSDPRIDVTGDGAGPIVVIATTGDPSTPYDSTVAMAGALDEGVLVTVEAEQHTGYGVNDCVVDAVSAYLIDLRPPDDGLRCA